MVNTPNSGHCFEEGNLVLICDPYTSVHSSKAYICISLVQCSHNYFMAKKIIFVTFVSKHVDEDVSQRTLRKK